MQMDELMENTEMQNQSVCQVRAPASVVKTVDLIQLAQIYKILTYTINMKHTIIQTYKHTNLLIHLYVSGYNIHTN